MDKHKKIEIIHGPRGVVLVPASSLLSDLTSFPKGVIDPTLSFINNRQKRFMSKSVKLMSLALNELERTHELSIDNQQRVGVYCCHEGALGGEIVEMIRASDTDVSFKRLCSPRLHFQVNPGIGSGNLAIQLKATGPLNTYTHSEQSCYQALDQCELDFKTERIKAAFILAAFSVQDGLIKEFELARNEGKKVVEAAVAVFLTCETYQNFIQEFKSFKKLESEQFFGLADPLVHFLISESGK